MKFALTTVACLLLAPSSFAAKISTFQPAQVVLGQLNFTSSGAAATANRMNGPRDVAVDPTTGKVYVADSLNNRVLRFSSAAALANNSAAELAFGQSSTDSGASNSPAATTMFRPSGLAFDTAGRLYVADTGFNRVLRFDTPSSETTNGVAADCVLGQSSASTGIATISATGMNGPTAVAVILNQLWVADTGNNRVIAFDNPQTRTTGANSLNRVLGQATGSTKDAPTPPTAASLNAPEGVAFGADGVLWVSDTGNNRLLRYPTQTVNGTPADAVLGQPNFTSNATPGAPSATNLYRPERIALDASGSTVSLWVVDRVHYRVLRHDDVNNPALPDGAAAAVVLGQSNFVSDNGGDTTQRTFRFAYGVTVDNFSAGSPRTIWVSDADNNRVLRFDPLDPAPPKIAGKAAYTTRAAKVKISGTISAPAGLAKLRYKVGKGGFRPVKLAGAKWSATVACKVGKNVVTIFATDKLQRTVMKKIVIKRKR